MLPILKLLIAIITIITWQNIVALEQRDPTLPDASLDAKIVQQEAAMENEPAETLYLNAIFIAKDRRLAVINGTLLTVGDTIAGKKITAINNNTVVLLKDDISEVLRLPATDIVEQRSNEQD